MAEGGNTKLDKPKRVLPDVRPRPRGISVPMPYTGQWEKDNPVLAGRIWNCVAKHFQAYEDLIKRASIYSDSPIEEALLAALLTEDSAFYYEGDPILLAPGQPIDIPELGEDTDAARFIVAPQFKVDRYRIDIACFYTWTGKRVAIECDGHEFHEKTKEQAAHDKARDRFLSTSGWTVLRFTGSEIHKDPFGCALQVARFLAADEVYSPDMLIPGGRK